jgi:shikimate kinase
MRIVLAGFMGTGKSAVGRRLADRRGLPFVDLDSWIEERAGMPVREVFAQQGEVAFRELEKRVVRDACALDEAVIAAGGGAVVDDENREALADGGLLFCLVASPEAVLRRVGLNVADRPLLAGHSDVIARIRELQAEREPAYARIPRQIDTSDLDVEQVVRAIETAIDAAASAQGASS